jgi:hypothetical protein
MSRARASRTTLVALLLVLAGGLLVALAPFEFGGLRLLGVGLLWWYVALVGPLAAIALTMGGLRIRPRKGAAGSVGRPGVGAFASWLAPVVLLTVAARVYAGGVEAPLILLGVVVASLIPLVTPPLVSAPTNVAGALAGVIGVGLCLWANLLALGDVASVLSLPRATTVAAVAAVTVLLTVRPILDRGRGLMLVIGVAALSLPVVGVGVVDGWPWSAWAAVATRPALAFGERSASVVEGRALPPATTLTFTESHRITARSPGVYRVIERDGDHLTIREWRLAVGDSLALRPGDNLTVPGGVTVGFERGKRVPGVAPSGVAWADPPERNDARRLPGWLGLLGTLVLSSSFLVVPPRPVQSDSGTARTAMARGAAWPVLVVAAVLTATCWGLYALHDGADGALAPSPFGALFEVRALGTWGRRAPAALAGAALAGLFLASAAAFRDRVAALVSATSATGAGRTLVAVWVALLGVAALLATWPGDAWRVLLTGLGLAAAGWAAPALAGVGRRAEALGSLAGSVAFIALLLGLARWPGGLELLSGTPAVLAALAGWGVARIAGRFRA